MKLLRKKQGTFSFSVLVYFYIIIFMSDCKIYFFGFINTLPLKIRYDGRFQVFFTIFPSPVCYKKNISSLI